MAANKLFYTQLWVMMVSYYLTQCTWTQHATAAVLNVTDNTLDIKVGVSGNEATRYTHEDWLSTVENCNHKLGRVLQDFNPDFKQFALSFEQSINVFFKKNEWPPDHAYEDIFGTLLMGVIVTRKLNNIGLNRLVIEDLPRMYEELADTRFPDIICQHLNKVLTIFQIRYCERNAQNMSMIEDMLKNGTTEALKYADWFLHGREQHVYDAPRVNVIVLVVTDYENEKRVVLQTCHKSKVTTANYWPNSFTRPT